jgi:hypothetical protein
LIFAAEAVVKAVSARFGSANGFSEKDHKRFYTLCALFREMSDPDRTDGI